MKGKEMAVISIIVPVYNAEKSLKRCIDSLMNQTYKHLEIILVDDGSTDGSGEMCNQYASQDQRIVVIHKENAGVSSARNTGIEHATGTYIQFVDSDDYLDLNACEILVNGMEENQSELVICGCVEHRGTEKNVIQYEPMVIQSIKELSGVFGRLYRSNLLNIPWNKLFFRDKIKEGFDETISLGEDLLFNINYMKQIEKIVITDAVPYHYIIESTSLSRRFRKEYMDVTCRIQKEVSCFAKTRLEPSYEQSQIDGAFALSFYRGCGILVMDMELTVQEKKTYLKRWMKNNQIIDVIKNAAPDGMKEKIMKKMVQLKMSNTMYYLLRLKSRYGK